MNEPRNVKHLFSWPWDKYDRYRCPDGSIKRVLKDINSAFPLKFSAVSANAEASAEALKKAKGTLKGSYANRLEAMLVTIDSTNASMQLQYRAAYSSYANDPCSGYENFVERERQISKNDTAIRHAAETAKSLENIIKSIKPETPDASAILLIEKYLTSLEGVLGRGADFVIAQEMRSIPTNTDEWNRK